MKRFSPRTLFLSIIGVASLVFFSISWFSGFSFYAGASVQSICFFGLTWFCADKLKDQPISPFAIALAIIIGRVIWELPIRIIDFYESIISLMLPVFSIVSIVLGLICYREKRAATYFLSGVVLILLNTYVHQAWLENYIPGFK